jgi:hypothetical protein
VTPAHPMLTVPVVGCGCSDDRLCRARTADAAMIEICNVVQAEFDKTRERDITADVPWLSSDLKEVVEVAFGCPP